MALVERLAWKLPAPARAAALWQLGKRHGELAYHLIDSLVGAGDVVADIGANWGRFALRFERLVGPTGEVHAFEPSPALQARIVQAAGRRLVLHPVALSDRAGEATWAAGPAGTAEGGISFDPDAAGDLVRVARLDDELGDLPSCRLIKCDVEGHEAEVLRGGPAVLERHAPALLIEIEQRHGSSLSSVQDLLDPLGYKSWALTEQGLEPTDGIDWMARQAEVLEREPDGPLAAGYVNDFLFLAGENPPATLLTGSAGP